MRSDELIVLGLAGLAVWFIFQGRNKGATFKPSYAFVKKAAPDYAEWQYFTDGTAISPEGDYYLNGELVWSAPR